jgi:phosphoenolpyruvate phosphomutase
MKSIPRLLQEKGVLAAIGAHDGISGILGERAGFDLIWGSGFEISASFGTPDANVLTMTEQLDRCALINETVSIPVIADCDNGFGNAINTVHTVRKFERAGISGICIEDNVFPKKCSFYDDVCRELVPLSEHALKIRACKETQETQSFFVIARTEALIAGFSMDEAVERATAYAEAGADAILIHSKEKQPGQILEFAERWTLPTPLVAVPTTYDAISMAELDAVGYKIVIYANQGLRSAIKAVQENLSLLRSTGRASVLRDRMASLEEVFDLVNLKGLQATEQKYLNTPYVPRTV